MILIKLKTNLLFRAFACVLLSLFISSCSGLISDETPKCESEEASDGVIEIINKKNTENSKNDDIRLLGQLIGRDLTVPVLKLSQIKTVKFDKESSFRACVAKAKLANGESGDIGYTIRWEDKRSGTYYIEIKDAESIVEQYTSAEEKAAAIAAFAAQEKAKKDAIDADLAKKAAEALQAEKEIAAKNAEPHEEIINPPPLPAAKVEESPPLGHCKGGEVTYFSCQVKSSRKFISICGSKFFDEKLEKRIDGAWIQYRFGELDKIELAYPMEKIGSIDKFTAYEDFKMQSSFLVFNVGKNEYSIDNDWNSEMEFFGVRLNANGKKIEIPCKDYPQSSDYYPSANNFRSLVIELKNSKQ